MLDRNLCVIAFAPNECTYICVKPCCWRATRNISPLTSNWASSLFRRTNESTMSYPTGMGANTGLRYNRIAGEMMDFVNNNSGQQPRSYHARSHCSRSLCAWSSHGLQRGRLRRSVHEKPSHTIVCPVANRTRLENRGVSERCCFSRCNMMMISHTVFSMIKDSLVAHMICTKPEDSYGCENASNVSKAHIGHTRAQPGDYFCA